MTQLNPKLMGTPPTYTPERLAAILKDIGRRVPYEFAAEANGISERTLYRWIIQGREEGDAGLDTPLANFCQDLKSIERDKIAHHMDKINDNVERWQSDAWILERRFHKHFGANVQLREIDERLSRIEEKANKKDDVNGI